MFRFFAEAQAVFWNTSWKFEVISILSRLLKKLRFALIVFQLYNSFLILQFDFFF